MGGPFTGLFKGSPKDQPHRLDLTGSAFVAWDDNVLAQTPGGGIGGGGANYIDPRFIRPGVASGFQSGVSYGFHKSGTRSSFNIGAIGSVQQFESAAGRDPFWFYGYNLDAGLKTNVTPKTSISFATVAAFAPYYQYAPFLRDTASAESPVSSDYGFAVDSVMVRSTGASASVENRFTKKSAISAGVSWEQRTSPDNEQADVEARTVRAAFTHSLTRKLGFHVGYGITESRYKLNPDAKPVRSNQMDIGLGYGDGVTFRLGRSTVVSLSIGASIAKNGDPVSVAKTGKETAFMVTGAAAIARPLGRSWGTSAGYVRGTSYVIGFAEPLITDGANAGIGGPLTSRLHFSAGAGASRGQQLFSSANGDIISYTASTKLTFALFTHLGIYSQASYYRFSIPKNFTSLGFIPDLDRRSVSVGLTTWLPLIKPPRVRSDAGQTTTGQP